MAGGEYRTGAILEGAHRGANSTFGTRFPEVAGVAEPHRKIAEALGSTDLKMERSGSPNADEGDYG